MFCKLLLLLLTTVGANPIYIGTPLTLDHHLSQTSGLISQPLSMFYQNGNLEHLTKGLLASHIGGQISKALPLPIVHPATTLSLATPEIHHAAPILYPIKKEMIFPEKKIAGALIKQVPKVSKLPISVSFSPKSLEFSSIGGSGILEGGLSGGSVLPEKSLISGLGIPYGF